MPSDASWSPDAADHGAFAEHCARVNAERLEVTLRALVLITLVVAPLLFLFQTDQTAPWQVLRGATAIVVFGLTIVALRAVPAVRRRADLVGAAMVALDMAVNAHSFARVGGLETLHIGITCVTPLLGILFLLPRNRRIAVAAIPAGTYFVVFFASRPAALRQPYVVTPFLLSGIAITLNVVVGGLIFRLSREHHAQRARLAGETARLESAVRARTVEVMELARNLVSLEETERTRIARELHDELGQELTGARLEAGVVVAEAREALGDDAPTAQRASGVEARIATAQRRVRDAIFSLRPPALDDFDLSTAIRMLVDRYRRPDALTIDYEASLDGVPLTDTQATTVFRVLQEALTNVTRHARAARVRVRIAVADGHLVLEVADDGAGVVADRLRPAFGLRGMRERLRLVAGDFSLDPRPEGGTLLRVAFPLTQAPAAVASEQTASSDPHGA